MRGKTKQLSAYLNIFDFMRNILSSMSNRVRYNMVYWISRSFRFECFCDASIDVGLPSSNLIEKNGSSFVNHLEGGHGLNAIFLGNSWVFVYIDFDQIHTMFLALRDYIGGNGLAGSAPCGVEVNQTFV